LPPILGTRVKPSTLAHSKLMYKHHNTTTLERAKHYHYRLHIEWNSRLCVGSTSWMKMCQMKIALSGDS